MPDPALHTAAIAGLEFVVNQALALDQATLARLAELQGRVLKVECTAPQLSLYCLPTANKLQLKGWHDDTLVDSTLRGSLSDFIQLLQADDKAGALVNGQLQLSGDSSDFIQLQSALAQLDIDWELPLSRFFGDVGAHQIGKLLRGSVSWGRHVNQSLTRQLEEFLHEEARLFPPRLELENFYTDVNSLNLRVDRLEARLSRLKKRLQAQ